MSGRHVILQDYRSAQELLDSIVRPNDEQATPTEELYGDWEHAYRFLNDRLFDVALPDCVITLTWRKSVLGYFRRSAFETCEGRTAHEIAINPTQIRRRGVADALSTLAHEMCHLWRTEFGPPNRKGRRGSRGYHDAVWADRMEAIGLMPSTTGRSGGRRTGYRVDHYVVVGGPFDKVCRELLIGGFTLTWRDRSSGRLVVLGGEAVDGEQDAAGQSARSDRRRFSCPACRLNAWAKPSAKLVCGDCHVPLAITA